MNCQAFRKAWLDDTDGDTHSHIETCDECIAWIETQMTTEEEVQFLKEVPLPHANLEDRIMQAIYQNAGQGVPPHAATASSEQHTTTAAVLPIPKKRWTKGFPSYAWVSAAAVLLAVGFVSYQQFSPESIQMASIQENNQADTQNALALNEPTLGSPETSTASVPAPAAAPKEAMPKVESAPESAATATQVAPVEPSAKTTPPPVQSQGGAIAMGKPEAKAVTPEPRTTNKDERTIVASRGLPDKSTEQGVNAKTALPADSAQPESNASATGDKPTTFGIASEGNPENADGQTAENAVVGPTLPSAAKQPITFSSFSDLNTAVQASDMPVPALAQTANAFSLSTVSVQYESETSQKVERLTSEYKRNDDWIRIEVVRNTEGKRSLSIPGTFSATQLFAVNGEQAIAVSFDQTDAKASAAQHSVHFNANPNNQSLYVVMTANGMTLNELMDAAKQITWNL